MLFRYIAWFFWMWGGEDEDDETIDVLLVTGP